MRECGDDVRELLHDHHPTACVEDAAFAYADVFRDHGFDDARPASMGRRGGGQRPYVAVDESGSCYAKSLPSDSYGSAGTTSVYRVAAGAETSLGAYPWYSRRIYLQCNTPGVQGGISIVQFGPWPRGRQAATSRLAIAFHANGRLLRSYSRLDIAVTADNVSASKSHYQVVRNVEGYVYEGGKSVFRLNTTDGRRLTFDPATGNLLSTTQVEPVR
jgi:hypothetical protein